MLDLSRDMENEIIKNRRKIHEFAEIEFDLPQTINLVKGELEKMDIQAEEIGRAGLTFTIGQGSPVILLRADMDALPMKEQSGLSFSSKNDNAHCCGHDAHTAMLLGSAKILKSMEDSLNGTIKFMFQPAEEILSGALDMVNNGILDNPKVDRALALHIAVGEEESKSGYMYYSLGNINYSGDAVKLTIVGKEAHGSNPHLGIDAINIAVKIIEGLNSLEKSITAPEEPVVILVGKINGGTAVNTVADKVELEISLRAKSEETRQLLLTKVRELSTGIGELYGGHVIFEHSYGMPNMINDRNFSQEMANYAKDFLGEDRIILKNTFTGSEDFSVISQRIPSFLFSLGVGSIDEGYDHSLHDSQMVINENALCIGAGLYSYLAKSYLDNL